MWNFTYAKLNDRIDCATIPVTAPRSIMALSGSSKPIGGTWVAPGCSTEASNVETAIREKHRKLIAVVRIIFHDQNIVRLKRDGMLRQSD